MNKKRKRDNVPPEVVRPESSKPDTGFHYIDTPEAVAWVTDPPMEYESTTTESSNESTESQTTVIRNFRYVKPRPEDSYQSTTVESPIALPSPPATLIIPQNIDTVETTEASSSSCSQSSLFLKCPCCDDDMTIGHTCEIHLEETDQSSPHNIPIIDSLSLVHVIPPSSPTSSLTPNPKPPDHIHSPPTTGSSHASSPDPQDPIDEPAIREVIRKAFEGRIMTFKHSSSLEK